MNKRKACGPEKWWGFLCRLSRNTSGNVLMLTAAMIIPLTGMVGGALDLSRLYLVKARLQHACDAGALAGRRAMGGGAWGTDDRTVANQFFDSNFKAGAYGTGPLTRTFTQPSGGTIVHGTASASVPMTLMRVFGAPTQTIAVNCDSDMQMPNTDVMFVLDTTGSMADDPSGKNVNGGSTSKIAGLRNAVKCFYEVLAQLRTNGTCTTTITNTGIPVSTQLRFGFVPYSTNVNITNLNLPSSYFATSWPYQSREVYQQSWGSWSDTNISCGNEGSSTSSIQYQEINRTSTNRWGQTTTICVVQSHSLITTWHYGKIAQSLTGFSNSNASVSLPIGSNGQSRNVTWDGCTEESASTNDINTMNAGQLAPALPDALFLRASGTGSLSSSKMTTGDQYSTSDFYNSVRSDYYFCPTPARALQTWTTSDFDNYVNSLTPSGNTYHDVGMLWGGRLLSPEGIFSATNQTTPTGGQIQRHMIFMTDGDAQAFACDYQQFGIAWWDRRTDSNVGSASNCGGVNTSLTNDINTRLVALCTAVKAEPNTILWVISFGGTGIAKDTKTRLQKCATDTSHYFDATDNNSLQTAFQTIAAKIAQLRITG